MVSNHAHRGECRRTKSCCAELNCTLRHIHEVTRACDDWCIHLERIGKERISCIRLFHTATIERHDILSVLRMFSENLCNLLWCSTYRHERVRQHPTHTIYILANRLVL